MRELLVSLVRDVPNAEVISAPNGMVALRQISEEKFDLIITDINMPKFNGLELIAFVRKSYSASELPILVVTTETAERDRQKGLSLGANAYVSKPFRRGELMDALNRLLALSKG